MDSSRRSDRLIDVVLGMGALNFRYPNQKKPAREAPVRLGGNAFRTGIWRGWRPLLGDFLVVRRRRSKITL
jgi:hypothetical protein